MGNRERRILRLMVGPQIVRLETARKCVKKENVCELERMEEASSANLQACSISQEQSIQLDHGWSSRNKRETSVRRSKRVHNSSFGVAIC